MQIAAGTELPTQALIFDMDGTLVDSTSVIAGLWRRWSARHGVDPDAVLLASPGRRTIETVMMFAPRGVDTAAEAASLTKAATEATEGLTSIPGAAALLRSLPIARWAVVTSAERALAERWLRLADLPVPDILVAAEDLIAGKPDPEGYVQAAGRLGFSPVETVVFEDAPAGLAAGRAAGAHVIALATTLTEAELEPHDWLRDFAQVSFTVELGGCPMLKIGTGLQA